MPFLDHLACKIATLVIGSLCPLSGHSWPPLLLIRYNFQRILQENIRKHLLYLICRCLLADRWLQRVTTLLPATSPFNGWHVVAAQSSSSDRIFPLLKHRRRYSGLKTFLGCVVECLLVSFWVAVPPHVLSNSITLPCLDPLRCCSTCLQQGGLLGSFDKFDRSFCYASSPTQAAIFIPNIASPTEARRHHVGELPSISFVDDGWGRSPRSNEPRRS